MASDHERGCQGREYVCTCGYDDRIADRITQQDAVIAGLVEAMEKVLPITVADGPYYASVYFGGDGNHSSEAMTMNPQHWLDIAAALAKAKESRDV